MHRILRLCVVSALLLFFMSNGSVLVRGSEYKAKFDRTPFSLMSLPLLLLNTIIVNIFEARQFSAII